jgi:prevent-host-death family protein
MIVATRGIAMNSVGVRDLKNRLSHHLKRVRAGAHLVVTERGRPIATLVPVEVPADMVWAHTLVAAGRAHWSGGKPAGAKRPVRVAGQPASDAVLEDRR